MRFNRKGKKNGPRVKTKPGCSQVSYCPECPQKPGEMVTISDGQKQARCKAGHVWAVRH